MASLLLGPEDEALIREIMRHVRHHVLAGDEQTMFLCLMQDGTFRGYFRWASVVAATALPLVSLRKGDKEQLVVSLDSPMVAKDLYKWVMAEADKGPATREECVGKRLMA